MRLPWKRRPEDEPREPTDQPDVEHARHLLAETKKRRPEIERKAALMRWHLHENDFRRRVLGMLEEESR